MSVLSVTKPRTLRLCKYRITSGSSSGVKLVALARALKFDSPK